MKIRLNRELCVGHGQCFIVDDQLFPLDDDGYSAVVDNSDVPAGRNEDAEHGAYSCPAGALSTDRE